MRYHEIISEFENNARLDRARTMGFDTNKTWYHATPYVFDKFVPSKWRHATYFADSPEGAIRGASAGGAEHPALSGPTTTTATKATSLHIIPVYIRGKTWGRDPLPLQWFPEDMSYGTYKSILAGSDPIEIPSVSTKGNDFINRIRKDLIRLIYTEAVPVEDYEKYVDDTEDDLPLERDRLPIPEPFFSYEYVEGMDNYIVETLKALGFDNWLVNDEAGVSIAVSNPANIRVKHANFDPVKKDSHAMGESKNRK